LKSLLFTIIAYLDTFRREVVCQSPVYSGFWNFVWWGSWLP